MIESEIVSTPEVCINKIPITPNPYVSTKNPSARTSLRPFSETLGVKHKTAFCGVGAAKANRKAIKTGNVLWSKITNHHCCTKQFKGQRIS